MFIICQYCKSALNGKTEDLLRAAFYNDLTIAEVEKQFCVSLGTCRPCAKKELDRLEETRAGSNLAWASNVLTGVGE